MALSLVTVTACSGAEAGDEGGQTSNAAAEPAEIRLWLNGTDTPQELRDYLVETFEAENEGSTLVIEEQDWNGLVPRLSVRSSWLGSFPVVTVPDSAASGCGSPTCNWSARGRHETPS